MEHLKYKMNCVRNYYPFLCIAFNRLKGLLDFLKWAWSGRLTVVCLTASVLALSVCCMDPPVREQEEGDLREGGGFHSNPLSSYRHHYAR